ncbi:MAG: hypothetical protein IPL52_05395 [Flavobacteriales bacterium]|nr:hypothetical protein [Flavobacteriales bacterium]
MPRRDLPPLTYSQQLVWKALSLLEEDELVGMLRMLRNHPDRNATIDGVNAGLDQGFDLLGVFSAEFKGLNELQYEGSLELHVELGRDGLVFLGIGFNGALGEVADFKFTFDTDGRIVEVEFEGSHNDFLNKGFFDDTVRFS